MSDSFDQDRSTQVGLLTADTASNLETDPSERTDAERDAQAVLTRLLREADDLSALNEGWSAAMSAVLLRSFERRDLDTLRSAQEGLRDIAASARRVLVHASLAESDAASSEDVETARASFQTASAFVSVADAGAAIARPATVAFQPDWGTIPGRILATLSEDRPTLGKEVRDRIQTSESQLSRAFKLLLEHGLVARRHFGKQAAWTLTTAGAQAVADAPAALVADDAAVGTSFPTGSIVWATSIRELEEALTQDPDEILLGSREGRGDYWPAAVLTKLRFAFRDELPKGNDLLKVPDLVVDTKTHSAYLKTITAQHADKLSRKLFKAPIKTSVYGIGSKSLLKVMPAKGWNIIVPGTDAPLGHARTQREAISRAKSLLSGHGGGEVHIHDKTGKLREQDVVDPSSKNKRGPSA